MDLSIKKRKPAPITTYIKDEPIYDDQETYTIPHPTEYYPHPHYPPFYPQVTTTTNTHISTSNSIIRPNIVRSNHVPSPNPNIVLHLNVSPNPIGSPNPTVSSNTNVSPNIHVSPNSTMGPKFAQNSDTTRLSPNPAMSPNSDSGHSDSSRVSSSDTVRDFNCNTLGPASSLVKNCSRPFKAIDPLSLALGGIGVSKDSADAYAEFRQRMLSQVQTQYSGTNKNMRRSMNSTNSQSADPTYLEKRKRNNEAAKRSRDARRAKEDEIAIRCAFLEQENIRLKLQLAAIEKQKKLLLSLTSQH